MTGIQFYFFVMYMYSPIMINTPTLIRFLASATLVDAELLNIF
jgi:hypothetical protein